MRRWDPLNDRQLDVLKRIDAGEDLSGADHARLRHSANALRDRGLITIRRPDGHWSAAMTEAGRFYMDHGHHPNDPRHMTGDDQRQPWTAKTLDRSYGPAVAMRNVSSPSKPAKAPTRRQLAPSRPVALTANRRRTEAKELIERLGAEGLVVIKAPTEEDIARWRKVVDFAKRHDLVPEGRRIEKTHQWNRDRDLHIRLVKGSHANTKPDTSGLPAVHVPETLRSAHPVVADLRDDADRLVMPQDRRRRCLLILQALAAEATKRGHRVTNQPVSDRYHHHYYGYGPRPDGPRYSRRDGELNLVVDGFSYTVTIQEASPNSEDPDRARRLVLELPAYQSEGRQYRWTDGKRRTVEGGLAALLREVETRAGEDRQRRIDEERARAERKVKWERAMAAARNKATEAYYAKVLDEQMTCWRGANELRTYRDALAQRLARPTPENEDLTAARQWLAWVDRHIERTDPTETPPPMPAPPRLKNEDLVPYLGGWSPYGPDAHLNSEER